MVAAAVVVVFASVVVVSAGVVVVSTGVVVVCAAVVVVSAGVVVVSTSVVVVVCASATSANMNELNLLWHAQTIVSKKIHLNITKISDFNTTSGNYKVQFVTQ